MLFQGAGCLQLSLCQHFVARKAAAAKRNPYLAASAIRPSLPCTSFTVTISTAIYFPWSLYFLCCWLRGWQRRGRAALGWLSWDLVTTGPGGAVLAVLVIALSLWPIDQGKKDSGLQLKDPQHSAVSQQWQKCTECFLRRLFQAKTMLPCKGLSFFIV